MLHFWIAGETCMVIIHKSVQAAWSVLFWHPFRTETLILPTVARVACWQLTAVSLTVNCSVRNDTASPSSPGNLTFSNCLMQEYKGLAHLLPLGITLKGHQSFRTSWGIDWVCCCNCTAAHSHLLLAAVSSLWPEHSDAYKSLVS